MALYLDDLGKLRGGGMALDMDKETKGAWIIHHSRKIISDTTLRTNTFVKKTSTNRVSKVQIPPGEDISRLVTANL